MIPFNKPYLSGKEAHYIFRAVYEYSQISGNGHFTKQAQRFFEERFGFKKTLMTTSCTDALEMAAILLNIKKGDQVIVPSYTFVSTANAFALHGAEIVFADSSSDNPNMDADKIESLITEKTKAIVPVHYAGIACDMDTIMAIARKHNLFVVEDAAQAIDSTYNGKPLGGIGHLGTFSFHETKNIQSGEGGLLSVNDEKFIKRAEIIWEKGTNRAEFFRGEVNKYGWVDLGSSFLPSDMISAFLYAQLENLDNIQNRRKKIWQNYFERLQPLQNAGKLKLPHIPDYAVNNAHMFYLVCNTPDERTALLEHLKKQDIKAVFHYLALHNSDYYKDKHDGRPLPVSEHYENCLLRLPFYYELSEKDINRITQSIINFYG